MTTHLTTCAGQNRAEPVHAGLSAEQADGIACVTCLHPLPGGTFAGRGRLDVGRSAETGSVVFACPGVCADLATTPAFAQAHPEVHV